VLEHLREIARRRTLLGCLVLREVRARYRGSALGFLWTFANPVLLLGVYVLVFDRFTGPAPVARYPLYALSGILPWLWISSSLSAGCVSLVHGAHLVTEACLPSWIPPAVVVLSNLVNFALSLPVALAAALAFGVPLHAGLLLLPAAFVPLLLFLHGATLAAATLTVLLRDVQHLVQSLLLVWFLLTPVAYPASSVPPAWSPLLAVNPAAALLLPFQAAIHGGRAPGAAELGVAAAWGAAAFVGGIAVYASLRGRIAEEL